MVQFFKITQLYLHLFLRHDRGLEAFKIWLLFLDKCRLLQRLEVAHLDSWLMSSRHDLSGKLLLLWSQTKELGVSLLRFSQEGDAADPCGGSYFLLHRLWLIAHLRLRSIIFEVQRSDHLIWSCRKLNFILDLVARRIARHRGLSAWSVGLSKCYFLFHNV